MGAPDMETLLGPLLQVYLHQASETTAASIAPPGVTRTLASKACRHAIMFGDSLTADQSHRLIQALLETSLWSICAHGRPTTASVVDLGALQGMVCVRRHVIGKESAAVKSTGGRYTRLRSQCRQPHAAMESSLTNQHGKLQNLSKRLMSWQNDCLLELPRPVKATD